MARPSSQSEPSDTAGPPEHVDLPEQANPPEKPVADPEAVDPDAVKTAPNGLKVGWQQPPKPIEPLNPATCVHTGLVVARLTLNRRELGDEWVCACGQIFVVTIGDGGNKILSKKEEVTLPEE